MPEGQDMTMCFCDRKGVTVQKANQRAGRSLVKDAAAVIEDVPLHTHLKPSEQ